MRSGIIKFEIDLKKLANKINIFGKIQKYLDTKLNTIRKQWFDNIMLLTGNNPCNLLQNIKVEFGITGYKIVHTSGLELAHKSYNLPIISRPTKFKLNIRNIITLLFKMYGIEIDFSSGVVFRVMNTETICGKPVGFVIDYHKSKMVFIFENSELTKSFIFGIKVCQGVLKVCESHLKYLFK